MTDKLPVIDREEYTVFIEHFGPFRFVHCDVHGRWRKALKQNLLSDFNQYAEQTGKHLFAAHYEDQGEKHIKFLSLFGFVFVADTKDASGRNCSLYGRTPNG
ncbi:hypothetical protein [Pyruvatibacter sp.]